MRNDKKHAVKLRRSGKSYLEISKIVGVPKSTLAGWFKNEEWSNKMKQKNLYTASIKARKHMIRMNGLRAVQLAQRYVDAKNEADKEFERHSTTPLFTAALMLYLGEGDKSMDNNLVRITNVDPAVLRIFYLFVKRYCTEDEKRVRAWILLYPDLNPQICHEYWSRELGLSLQNFYKAQVIKGKHKTKKLHYGVGTITIGCKRLKVKILRWIELSCKKLEFNAGMV